MSRTGIQGRGAAVLVCVILVLCFYKMGQPVLIDYFEAATALTAKTMFHQGQWLLAADETGAKPYYPALLYWSQLAGYELFGVSALGARFFTALASVLTVFTLYQTAEKTVGKRTALRASLITASSLLFLFMSRVASGDILSGFFLLLNVILFWSAVERAINEEKSANISFYTGCLFGGLAMLSGGLILVLIPLLTLFFHLVTLGRFSLLFKVSWLLPGIMLFIGIALAPGLIAVVNGGGDPVVFFTLLLQQQMGGVASVMPVYGHRLAYGILLFLAGMLPWCCYLALAVTYSSLFSKKTPGQRFVRLVLLYSMLVVLVSPFSVHGGLTLCTAAIPGAALLLAQLFERIDVQYSKRWIVAGWLTVILFAGITLFFFVLPVLINVLPARFSEFGQIIPLLSDSVELGYEPYLTAAILAFLSFTLYRGLVKRKVSAVYNGLTIAACGLVCTAVIVVYPAYDRLFMQPVSNLAMAGSEYSPKAAELLLYNIGSRPSAVFYGESNIVVKSEAEHAELQKLFDDDQVGVGVSDVYSLKRLRDFGVKVKQLRKEHGYVLFTVE